MNRYCEYFEIDESYWPEINPSSIKDPLNKWEKTFPHKTFVDILKVTERMLARGINSDKKGIWIEGAYGTGKSRVAWTLKNILDCSSDALKNYFAEYSSLKAEPDLRDKLLGHKEGKIITAYRYASSSIDGDRALIMAVYESITRALREAGVSYKGENTLRGGVAEWLSNNENKAFFNTLIALPEYRGLGSFAGKSADDIINLLKNPSADVDALMGDILSLAERRGITALTTSMDTLIEWLTDVIDQNELKAIVLVWDEFSAYFKKNRTSLDEFQKLSELSNLKPFYLIIVTHMSGSIFSESDQTGKIVRDRFVHKEIELPDSIAFELIRHALNVKDDQKEIWNTLADELNSRMPSSRNAVRNIVWNGTEAGEDVLKGMLPIHPLSALLLKNISTAFASNQRSMFNFIKNSDTKNLQAFQWFIDNYSPDNGDILTIDFLWNFFYEKGTDGHGSGVGRSNLDSIIRTVLDTYPKNENRLNTEQKRILKTVLMMQAISQKLGGSLEIFLPTEQNINYAFEGTDYEDNRAVNIIKNQLVKEGILYAKPTGNGKVQYAAAAVSGDQAQIDNIKERIEKGTKTSALVSLGDMSSGLSLSAALRFRYEIIPVTVENFTATINRTTNEPATYKIKALLSFARNDEEQNKIRDLIKGAAKEDRYEKLVFIDTSSTVIGGERFGQWVEYVANEEYWRTKDGKLADEMSRRAKSVLDEWKNDITIGSFTLYSCFAKTGEPYGNASSLITALSNTVIRMYPLSFDNVKVSDNFFTVSNLPLGAKYGIAQTYGGVYQESYVLPLLKGAWQVENYWESSPTSAISKLKIKVDELIKKAFDFEGRIAIGVIFDTLMEQGFMPCNLYALLTGFLLKEYSVDTYRYSDGETGDKMSTDRLAEIIGEYIKHKNTSINRYKEKYIELMTKEQKAFVNFAKSVFNTPDNLSVEQTAIKIRYKLKDLDYPIWCFKEIETNGLDDFIDKLAEIANTNNSGESIATVAASIGRMSLQTPTAATSLARLLTKDNAKKAILDFLNIFENGELIRIANEIKTEDLLLDVRRQFGAGDALWLWDQETGKDELRKLLIDYKIVALSNRINTSTTSLFTCFSEWREKTKSIRIPCSALITEVPKLKDFFSCLRDIATYGELAYDKRPTFLGELEKNGSYFSTFLSEKTEIFKKTCSFYLTGFSDDEVDSLYSKLSTNSFTLDRSTFEKAVAAESEKIRREQQKFQLHRLWESATSSKTPRDWSEKNRTPILSLVPQPLYNDARRAFAAINKNNPEDGEVKFALEFLQQKASFFSVFNDDLKINTAFVRDIIGRFAPLLPDPDEVRSRLESVITASHYEWLGNYYVQQEVEKLAQSKYNQNACDKVINRIEKMDAEKAKEYLKRLIKDNMNVGIEIISEGEN